MPAGTSPLAITAVAIAFTVRADVTKSLKEGEPVLDIDDEFVEGDAYDPTYDITCEGKGDMPDGLAAAVIDPDDIAAVTGGKTLVDSTAARQNHDKRNSWSFHAINFPSAA